MKIEDDGFESGDWCRMCFGNGSVKILARGSDNKGQATTGSCHNGGSSHNWNQATGDNDARTDIGYGTEKMILFKAG